MKKFKKQEEFLLKKHEKKEKNEKTMECLIETNEAKKVKNTMKWRQINLLFYKNYKL